MAYFKREGGGDRGGRGFGGGDRGGFKPRGGFGGGRSGGFGGGDRPEVFAAVCAECGKDTTVPFRPNGRKPVLCRDCFHKNDAPGERGGEFRKPSFGGDSRGGDRPRPSFGGDRERRPEPTVRTWGTSEAKIEEVSTKLDRIIRLLEEQKDRPAAVVAPTPVAAPAVAEKPAKKAKAKKAAASAE